MATTPYLTTAELKQLTIAPAAYVDEIEALEAGWTLRRLTHWSGTFNARLAKRYDAPFAAPYPEAILNWLEQIATWEVYLKRGVDPTDAQAAELKARHDRALVELKEAADSLTGLFELPLRADNTAGGVTRGAPLGYSEASPYTWITRQAEAVEDES